MSAIFSKNVCLRGFHKCLWLRGCHVCVFAKMSYVCEVVSMLYICEFFMCNCKNDIYMGFEVQNSMHITLTFFARAAYACVYLCLHGCHLCVFVGTS